MDKKNNIIAILDEIEQELRELKLWGGEAFAPSQEAFLSSVPFFMDTMDFHQWLEYVALPKLREIVLEGGVLPQGMLIHTYAEEYYRERHDEFAYLIKLLRVLDSYAKV